MLFLVCGGKLLKIRVMCVMWCVCVWCVACVCDMGMCCVMCVCMCVCVLAGQSPARSRDSSSPPSTHKHTHIQPPKYALSNPFFHAFSANFCASMVWRMAGFVYFEISGCYGGLWWLTCWKNPPSWHNGGNNNNGRHNKPTTTRESEARIYKRK